MADRVIFVASDPDEFMRGVSLPEEMLSDLLEVSRLSPERAEQIAIALGSANGFLDDAALRTVVREYLTNQGSADSVLRAIRALRPEAIEQTLKNLRTWQAVDPHRAERFPDGAILSLETILPKLIRSFPALERQRKARRLESLTGNQARQIEIICDARPVFDSERRVIEGFVTQTILKILYDTQREESGSIEVVLSPKQLDRLNEKVEKARQKLDVLRDAIEAWMPNGLGEAPDRNEGVGEE
jgi:hypothetical protein